MQVVSVTDIVFVFVFEFVFVFVFVFVFEFEFVFVFVVGIRCNAKDSIALRRSRGIDLNIVPFRIQPVLIREYRFVVLL